MIRRAFSIRHVTGRDYYKMEFQTMQQFIDYLAVLRQTYGEHNVETAMC